MHLICWYCLNIYILWIHKHIKILFAPSGKRKTQYNKKTFSRFRIIVYNVIVIVFISLHLFILLFIASIQLLCIYILLTVYLVICIYIVYLIRSIDSNSVFIYIRLYVVLDLFIYTLCLYLNSRIYSAYK